MKLQPRYKNNTRVASLRTRVRLGQAARSARVRRDAVRVSVRLSRNVTPLKYTLKLKPDLEAFVFEGEETIRLRIKKGTRSITLHSKELSIDLAEIIRGKEKEFALKTTYDEKTDTATFIFRKRIPRGTADLRLVFRGTLNDKMHGFYRSRYEVNGETRHMATTQFEATDARRAFPCFDEPAMKAVFHVTLVVPKDTTAISNTIPSVIQEHEDGRKSVVFAPTPKMSTYLLAFIAGDFEHIEKKTKEGVLVRVFTTPGKIHQAEFALSCAAKTVSFFGKYFKITYPLPVLDLIAAPDFAFGAMENWGAITFRETALLVDPKHSSSVNKQWVALVIAHELAHQWFGNLVTMEWWTHLWLNEGFASYIEYLAVDRLFPGWNIWTQFVHREPGTALELDALEHTHPIEIDVHRPDEIGEAFDTVSYSKGASIIRMLAEYIGENKFRDGLQYYLKKHSYSNTSTVHLWNAFERTSGKPIAAIMKHWTRKSGYPLITLSGNKNSFILKQERFFSSALSGLRSREKTTWPIPIVLKTVNGATERILMKRKTFVLPGKLGIPMKVNDGESGFFVTQYPKEFLATLKKPLQEKRLEPCDRLGLARDIMMLAESGKQKTEEALRFVSYYWEETDYTVWSELIASLNKIGSLVAKERFEEDYRSFVRTLLAPIVKKVGWHSSMHEDHTRALLRDLVLLNAGMYGEKNVIRRAQDAFKKIEPHKNPIHADLREVVYRVVARYGGTKEHAAFVVMYERATLHEEKNRIGKALGSFTSKDLLEKTLAFSMSNQVRPQDTVGIISSVWLNPHGRDLAWMFVKKNWNLFLKRYASSQALARLITSAGTFNSAARAKEVKRFFEKNSAPGASRTIEQAIEKIHSNAAWLSRERKALAKLFTRKVPLSSRTSNPARTNRRRS